MAFLASGKADAVDGVLFPHTCDSLQGLATEAMDFGAFRKKAFVFQHPRGADRASARRFLEAEMRSLAHELGEWTGTELTDGRLRSALDVHDEIDVYRAALLDGRARLPLSRSRALRSPPSRRVALARGAPPRAAGGRGPDRAGARPARHPGPRHRIRPRAPGSSPDARRGGCLSRGRRLRGDRQARLPARLGARGGPLGRPRREVPFLPALPDSRNGPAGPDRVTSSPSPREAAHAACSSTSRSSASPSSSTCRPSSGPSPRGAFPSSFSRASSNRSSPVRPRPGSRPSSSSSPRRGGPPDVPARPVRADRARPRPFVLRLEEWQKQRTRKRRGPRAGPFGPPIEATKKLKELMSLHYLSGRYADGAVPVAWVTSGFPGRAPPAARLLHDLPENHAALCGVTRIVPELSDAVEREGYSRDLCSYARTDLGCVATGRTPVGRLPRPDLLACSTNICQTVLYWSRRWPRTSRSRSSSSTRRSSTARRSRTTSRTYGSSSRSSSPSPRAVSGQRLDREELAEGTAGRRRGPPLGRVPRDGPSPPRPLDRHRRLLPHRADRRRCAEARSATPTTGSFSTS